VLRCLRVLRAAPLAGADLLVNVSQATQAFLDFHAAMLKSGRGRATIAAAPQLTRAPEEGAPAGDAAAAAAAAASDEASEEAAADKAAASAIQARRAARLRLHHEHAER
jgi:hypothetical protein